MNDISQLLPEARSLQVELEKAQFETLKLKAELFGL
jgi:hypothetical protein